MKFVLPFDKIRNKDVALVGGKNASLGEMFSRTNVPVPKGFAITSRAYRYFIKKNKLDKKIRLILKNTNAKKIRELKASGREIRSLIENSQLPEDLEKEIVTSFKKLRVKRVAIRSSATAEDLPTASFAGAQESYLNVAEKDLLQKVRKCFASLFTDRAISYREDKKFDHFRVFLSVGVQELISSKVSGVLFTIEPDSGHRGFIFINASWGLGDFIVQGKTDPDGYYVHKATMSIISKKLGMKKLMEIRGKAGVLSKKVPVKKQKIFVLNDKEILQLARYGLLIEKHYSMPMDIEWAKDDSGLHILQARPETVHGKSDRTSFYEYKLKKKSAVIAEGLAIGRKISSGTVNIIHDAKEINRFRKGQILVTKATDPDWEPIMKIASGIITEVGGKTAHAAIVSRELGIPCIVGVQNATRILKNGQKITIDCTDETGRIWKSALKYTMIEHDVRKLPKTRTKVYVNIGSPGIALDASQLPVDGVGLAREEFIISSYIGEHPLAMISEKKEKEYIDKLAEGVAKIAAAFYPRPVVVRFSDFKTNEYKNLKGGKKYEAQEGNPMIGWRGASRYINPVFEPAFRLECRAIKKVRDKMKLKNIKVMVPFCRTIDEAKRVIEIIKSERLTADVGVMAEIPSNIVLAKEFSRYFKFFSIGSNDLTQLTLGIDRDSEVLAKEFDERNKSVEDLITRLIKVAHKNKRLVSICGEAPSNYPDFARFLVKQGIDSISVEPDAVIKTRLLVHKAES
ncbi:MAG: phosphoenolpyruvate synthase [Candidatus Aenigmarchaeota archaeon]|nr:phosphoenolpyruvate synthase [Candidatus Aenigmarchaeota archaeon]